MNPPPIDDAWVTADPTTCPVCGRDACEDHLPPTPDQAAAGSDRVTREHTILTEAGAAERLAARHADLLRYDHRRGRWLIWTASRWMPDADAQVQRLALAFVRQWQHDALDMPDRARREDSVKFTLSLERRDRLTNLLALAKTMTPIAHPGTGWDADPYLLAVANGVVDLRTGRLRPGRPEDGVTLQTAVPFDPSATCPRWLRFIEDIFGGHADLQRFVWAAVGYSLTGLTSEQVLFMLHGTGSNGKGSLLNTLKRVFGEYAWNMPFSTVEWRDRTAIPNDLAALVSRRFVIASETNDGTRLNESRVKALTGCDPITARFLHSEFFEFDPVAKFWLAVNHKPVVKDDSFGFWRRIRLIPFQHQFPVNPTLADELWQEAPGILTWAVRGALAWQQDGLQAPEIVMAATKEYEADSDDLAAFLAEATEPDAQATVSARDLFEHYKAWAEWHHIPDRERLSQAKFGRKLAERYERLRDRTTGVSYRGLARRPWSA